MVDFRQHLVTELTKSQRECSAFKGRIGACGKIACVASIDAEYAVEPIGGFAGRRAIGHAEHGKKVAAFHVLSESVRRDASVNLPQIVAHADGHRGSIQRAAWRAVRDKRADCFVDNSSFNACVKSRIHTVLCLLAEPAVWSKLLRAPRQTWRYAEKYSRAYARIHPSALGGYTIEGPFNRRPSCIARALDRFFYWLGA